ncbi:MAG: VOC family protein [bacterium]|nr:VOC family protein [bacterium]
MAIIDHVDLRVRDRERAHRFFSVLLPELGLTRVWQGEEWTTYAEPRDGRPDWQRCFVSTTVDAEHTPTKNCVAFQAPSREEVDRLAAVAREAGARNIEGPEPYSEAMPGYYAVFFEDLDGNRFEVCHRMYD